MVNRISSLTNKKGAVGKLALGVASLMTLTVIGSSAMVGATPVTGSSQDKNATSLQRSNDQQNNRDHQKNGNNGNKDQDHNKNRGTKGYGGTTNNAVDSKVNINQSGHDNVLTVIINYIFG